MYEENTEPISCRVIHRMIKTARLHRRVIEQAVGELAIHHSQHMMLMNIYACKTPPSQRELARRLDISPAAVTLCLRKLEENGYITKTTQMCDTRVNHIEVTERGRELIEASHRRFYEIDEQMLQGFTDQEKEQLLSMYERMQYNLNQKSRVDGEENAPV